MSEIALPISLTNFCKVQFGLVTVVLLLGLGGYVFTHLTGHGSVLGLLHAIDVNSERSIPNYVSTVNLLLASILVFLVYRYEKSARQLHSGYWLFLSGLMLWLSVDEEASIHEKFTKLYHFLVTPTQNEALDMLGYEWILFGTAFAAVIGLIMLPFLRRLPKDTLGYFLLAGGIYLTGCLGFEYLGFVMLDTGMVESEFDFTFKMRRMFEEGFEMYGIVIFNCALYRELRKRCASITVRTASS